MKKHKPTIDEVIKARATLAGLSVEQLLRRTGITRSTWYRRLNNGGWLLAEIIAIDKEVHFTPDDIDTILKR